MKNTNHDACEAEIARMVDGMDFSDDPTPPPTAPGSPKVFITTLLAGSTVMVYRSPGDYWSELGAQGFMTSPEEAINAALDTSHTKYESVGETSQWVRHSRDELSRSSKGTNCTVKRVGGGWIAEVHTHTAQGWFRTAEAAMAAVNKALVVRAPPSVDDLIDDMDFED
jgi:hypothetical protein